jgi:hypothetical protein
MIFGTYDTETNGPWTLSEWYLEDAQYIANFVDVPGRIAGPLDLSAALTEGEPRFGPRTLEATFETSEGNRLDRKAQIATMIGWLSGWRMNITLPDDPDRYLVGRLHVEELYNDMAHAAVRVTVVCEPWLYANTETVVNLTAATSAQTKTLVNSGRRTVVPLLEISGTNASVLIQFGTSSWSLGAGTYQLPDMVLTQGEHALTYSGTGSVKLTYREAVLK